MRTTAMVWEHFFVLFAENLNVAIDGHHDGEVFGSKRVAII